jgi:hypothetical protein
MTVRDAPWKAEPKTKIVCTIGPATASEERLRALLQAGVDVIRLNFSHGTHADHQLVIERVRRLTTELSLPVAILQDLAGPKVRIGTFTTDSITLLAGAPFILTTRAIVGTVAAVSVSYPQLPQEVRPGDTLLLADGAVTLVVERVTTEDITCRVAEGGNLSARKGVNCPSGLLSLPILSEKDLRDVQFGIEHGVDYMGLSFVRTADDVRIAKAAIATRGGAIPVIAKIETQAALAHIDEILEVTDGIMVARGDLGIETPLPRIPVVQKQLIAKANRLAKPVITATQMLWSMVDNPRPSRAEATDVANAVLDGTCQSASGSPRQRATSTATHGSGGRRPRGVSDRDHYGDGSHCDGDARRDHCPLSREIPPSPTHSGGDATTRHLSSSRARPWCHALAPAREYHHQRGNDRENQSGDARPRAAWQEGHYHVEHLSRAEFAGDGGVVNEVLHAHVSRRPRRDAKKNLK